MKRKLATLAVAGASAIAAPPAEAQTYTTYATCYSLLGTMADGTYTRPRSVASNIHPLGTKLRLLGRSFHGMRKVVVRDTGSALWDGHLDIWFGTPWSFHSCSSWGRRAIRYKIGWGKP